MDLVVKVKDIRGRCPVYNIGDSIFLRDGYILDTKRSKPVCMHSLASLMPYYVALSRGVDAKDLGLSGPEKGKAYVQCLDPCHLTNGGTVTLEISPLRENET
jgi:uncharacterized repeat protein (TIGR04076 family)